MIPTLLTNEQAAELLGVRPNTLEIWRVKGQGPAYRKIGRRSVRYAESDLLAFIEAGTRQSTSQEFDHKSTAQSISITGRT